MTEDIAKPSISASKIWLAMAVYATYVVFIGAGYALQCIRESRWMQLSIVAGCGLASLLFFYPALVHFRAFSDLEEQGTSSSLTRHKARKALRCAIGYGLASIIFLAGVDFVQPVAFKCFDFLEKAH